MVVAAHFVSSPSPAQPPQLAVRRLMLTEFRGYSHLELALDPAPVVLTGPNGAGKTNVLEALSFLAPGAGLRRARLADAGRHGAAAPWTVAATLATPFGGAQIGTGLARVRGGADDGEDEGDYSGRRLARIDGRAVGPGAFAELLGVVWLTPQMDRLFTESAGGRRRFFDRLVLGLFPDHGRQLAGYEKAMRDRNRVLAQPAPDAAWLSALEAAMAEHGVAIAASRREALAALQSAILAGDDAFPKAGLALEGDLEQALDTQAALAAEEDFRVRLAQGRSRDAEAGRALHGPHRSNLAVRHIAKDCPAEQGSTGEQKALLIAIVLANARLQAERLGAPPLLLLDEVAAHLDSGRRAALFAAVETLGAQAWMTGTDEILFAPLRGRAQFFNVFDGVIAANGG